MSVDSNNSDTNTNNNSRQSTARTPRPHSAAARALVEDFNSAVGAAPGYAAEVPPAPWPGRGQESLELANSLTEVDRGISSIVGRLDGLSSLVSEEGELHQAREPSHIETARMQSNVGPAGMIPEEDVVVDGDGRVWSRSVQFGPVTAASSSHPIAYEASDTAQRNSIAYEASNTAQQNSTAQGVVGGRYFDIAAGDSGIGQLSAGTLDCQYSTLPLGIARDVPVRAVVCLDGRVVSWDERVAILDCGDYEVTVNRSCIRRRDFELIGVEPVCPVVKSLVNPLGAPQAYADASLDGVGVQLSTRPPEPESPNPAAPKVPQVAQGLSQTEIRNLVRHEVNLALRESGVLGSRDVKSAAGKTEAMQTALSFQTDGAELHSAYSDPGRRFRELDVEGNHRFFKCQRPDCYWETHTPFGLQIIDSARPASEPSELAASSMPAPQPASGAGPSQAFTFDRGSEITQGKPLSRAAERLATPAVFPREPPIDAVAPGDRLYKLDKLLGIEGIRRTRPTPAVAPAGAPARCAASYRPANQVAAPGPPPRSGVKLAQPKEASKTVRHYWGLLEQAVEEGCCTHVQSRAPTQQSRNDMLRAAMASRSVFWVSDCVADQEKLDNSINNNNSGIRRSSY